ncbi:hypothetical protein R53653_IHELHDKM_00904 [Fructobacillus cardui]|nr:hypothetical protein R53653_IHELHDKM_00904 [Fructobacillus cardui]
MPPSWFDESSFVHFKAGFIAVTKSLIHHYLVLILLIVLLLIIYFFQAGFEKSIESLIWFGSGMATLYALSFAPIVQDGGRSFFGGAIFLIISLFLLINNINQLEISTKWHTTVTIFSLALILLAGIKQLLELLMLTNLMRL